MKALIIYDSNVGNTKQIAEIIGTTLRPNGTAAIVILMDHSGSGFTANSAL